MGRNEVGLEGHDLFGVEKLHQVERLARALGVKTGHHQHMGIPLDHDCWEQGQPDRAVPRRLSASERQHRIVPFAIDLAARAGERVTHPHRLDGVVLSEFPTQVFTLDKAAQSRVEGDHVVVLQIDFNESLPVVVALVQLGRMVLKATEVQVRRHTQARQQLRHVQLTGRALKHQAVPLLNGVVAKIQAGVLRKMGGTHQLPLVAVSPAVQRAHNVAAGVSTALEHDGLPVAAHVGQQLYALFGANQHPAFTFVGQRLIVPYLGDAECVPEVARMHFEDATLFGLEQPRIKVAGNR